MEDVLSYNVIGEIKGSEHPENIMVVGGHLDSDSMMVLMMTEQEWCKVWKY
jgi:hypothetical protein